ncbi:uncharacterized protein LOC110706680 [Chenopodium quinoa]|uniref:uncharacterized protein LOC110706680 n=1 Tax=Chenopodium quinoa TaxID=63459 RepID=UPI000B7847F5|nr:uncharacterized protein LOC110706680 [Chenopodium quinoa]
MFTEGLDNSALQWVREGSKNGKKEEPLSVLDNRTRIDPIIRSSSRGFGLPPPGKFRSGHLPPTAIPVSRGIPGDDSASVSGNDITSESEEEDVYGGRYSMDSSPQDDRATPSITSSYRYSNTRSLPPTRMSYGSDYLSSDVYSSVELSGTRGERLVKKNGRYPVAQNGYAEDESEDSAGSSEFSSSQVGSNIRTASRSQAYVSEGYASSITSKVNIGKDDGDTPSAPPVCNSGQDANQAVPVPNNKVSADSHDASDKVEPIVPSVKLSGSHQVDSIEKTNPGPHARTMGGAESAGSSGSHAARLPTFHASTQGPWHSVVAYDACVRLCLNAWARSCMEAPVFLENECALLRSAFGLQQILLQSEEEILAKRGSEVAVEGAPQKPKKIIGKMKVQVRKVRMGLDPPTGCSFGSVKAPVINMESARSQLSKVQRSVCSGWHALRRVRFVLHKPTDGSLSKKSLAYVQASSQYLKQVSGLLKVGVVTTLRNSASSYEPVQESHFCLLRLKSSPEDDVVRMQPGSGETHVFFPDGLGDDLILEVQDSKGKTCGRVVAQVATVADDPNDKLRWWSIFHEPEHELVGKIQLYINFSTSTEENSNNKCGSVAETVAYDLVLEVAMKVQHFQQRHLLLHGEWKWLLEEFATYYGVSDAYTKLRYLTYVMDVATPTADCLTLVYDLLYPVVMKGHTKSTLSHQENRILGEVEDQIEQILALAFENYKSLDESLPSGMTEVFRPASGVAAPALQPAVKLYTLLHDILSPEAQNKLCRHFQAAAKKRSKRHVSETDEYVSNTGEGIMLDQVTMTTAYQNMRNLCLNISNEVSTDIEIHNQHILPSFVDLPNLCSSIYSVELCNRIREFLIACPPSGPSQPVAELVIATADFQRDLVNWNINPIKGGVDAKDLFHLYIVVWIQDKRLALLETCKLDKVKWSGVRTQHSTTPFVDEMYDRLKDTLNDYEVIVSRWPEYSFFLENAVADVEKSIVEALDRQYSDVLAPLKENLAPKKFGFKYMQKLTKRNVAPYTVPDEVGILLNSMKRMLDILRPKIETQFKSWGSCIPNAGNQTPGERLSEVTVMLRAKFRNYLQAIVEKLVENTRLQNATKIKKILQDSKESVGESDVRNRMQPLKEQLMSTLNHLHTIFETHVFIALCRGYWDRIGQDVLSFLENRKENKAWYKGSTIAVSVLDDTFASQMQQLLGHALQDKDIEPPRSMMEVRSMLCKDAQVHKSNTFYY